MIIAHAHHHRVLLLTRLDVIQLLDEKKIRELLNHLQRIRDSTRVKYIPNAVNLVPLLALQHDTPHFPVSDSYMILI